MNERKATVLALSAALLLPQSVRAQVTSKLEAGSLVTSSPGDDGAPMNIFRVAPDVLAMRPYGSLGAGTSMWLVGQRWQLADANASGTLLAPTVYGVRAELRGNASRAFDDRSFGANQVDVETRVSVPLRESSGIWVGGGVARPWKISAVSLVDLTDGGAWTRIGNATLSATLTNQRFTKAAQIDSSGGVSACIAAPAGDGGVGLTGAYGADESTNCSHGSSIRDLETSAHWEFARLELAGTAGYRFGDAEDVAPDSRRWGTATATIWVAPRLAIVAGGGRQPANIERGLPSRTFGTVGMQVAYAPSFRNAVPVGDERVVSVRTFDIRGAPDGMQMITVRVGGVERVEVTGDFSDWRPMALMRHRGSDVWELILPVEPGSHQINLRVDGGPWFAPPGLPTMRDGFGGQVGRLIVVR